MTELLKEDHPIRKKFEEYNKSFNDEENFYLLLEKKTPLSPFKITSVLKMAHFLLQKNPIIKRADSLYNQEFVQLEKNNVFLTPFINDEGKIHRQINEELRHDIFRNRLISDDKNYLLISGKLSSSFTGNHERHQIKSLLNIGHMLEAKFPFIKTYFIGTKIGQYYLFAETIKNQKIITPLLFLLLCIIIFFLFRSIKILGLFALVMMTSYAFVIYFIVLFEGGISAYSNFAMFFVLIVATSDLIHYFSCYVQIPDKTIDEKIREVNKQILWPCFLTTLTTSVCLIALVGNNFVPIRNIGIYSSIGSVICFVSTFYLLPIFLKLFNVNLYQTRGISSLKLNRIIEFTLKNPKKIITTFSIITIILIFKVTGIEIDDRFYDKFNKNHPLTTAVEKFSKSFNFIGNIDLSIRIKNGKKLTNPEVHKKLLEFENEILNINDVANIHSFSKFFKYLTYKFDKHFKNTQDAKDYRDSFYYMLDNKNSFKDFIDKKQGTIRSIIFIKTLSSKKLDLVTKHIQNIANSEKYKRFIEVSPRGFATFRSFFFNNLVTSMFQSIFFSLLTIFILFVFIFKSVKWALLGMLPNILPILFIYGILSFFNTSIGGNLILLVCIALGIAVDDTIHFLIGLKKELKNHQLMPTALKNAFKKTSKALLGTTMVFVLSFPSFFLAELKIFSQVGGFLMLALIVALITDLILLPAIFFVFSHRLSNKK